MNNLKPLNWVQKDTHICKLDEPLCDFCLHDITQRRLKNAPFLLHVEQLSIIRYYPAQVILRNEESYLSYMWERDGSQWHAAPTRIHTFHAPDQIRGLEEIIPPSPLGESERKCRAEQDLLFEGTGFLRNGYLSQERWECLKGILDGDTASRGIWELEFSEDGISQILGDNGRKINVPTLTKNRSA